MKMEGNKREKSPKMELKEVSKSSKTKVFQGIKKKINKKEIIEFWCRKNMQSLY